MDLIVSGRVVTPDGVIPHGWVGVAGGRIVALGDGTPPAADRHHAADDAWILPGIVDGQTHAGSYRGLPGLESTTRSAVAGGITTIVDMPYDDPAPLNDMDRLTRKVEAIARYAYCDVALYATILRGQDLATVHELIEGGACAFKISAYESSPTRFPRIPTDLTLDLFEALAGTDIPLGLHNEDQEIVHARIAKAKADGLEGIAAHSDSRPEAAELSASASFLELGATAGAHAHLVHLSSPRGFRLVDLYRLDGFRASGELCVHYLWFDPVEHGEALGALMKVNPPIRPGQRTALWEELRAGRVSFVSSDHSSWPVAGKLTPSIFTAGAGVPGLETLLPAFFTIAQRHGADGDDAARLCAEYLGERPARFFGLAGKGVIRPGADGDLTILAAGDHPWDAARAHDELNWSPYDGHRFAALVTGTYLRGRLVWDGETVLGTAGDGRYVPRGGTTWFQ